VGRLGVQPRTAPDPSGQIAPKASCILGPSFCFADRGQRDRGVRVGASRPHLGGDPDGFHQLFARGAMAKGRFGVPPDAVGSLRDMGDRAGDQLLGLCRQRPFGEDLLAERLKSSVSGASVRRFFGELA
jgi:hypothetical protein